MGTGTLNVGDSPQDHGMYVSLQRDCRKKISVSEREFENIFLQCEEEPQRFFLDM